MIKLKIHIFTSKTHCRGRKSYSPSKNCLFFFLPWYASICPSRTLSAYIFTSFEFTFKLKFYLYLYLPFFLEFSPFSFFLFSPCKTLADIRLPLPSCLCMCRASVASDAELKMTREVKVLQFRVEQFRGAVDQLKEKEKYQRYQVGKIFYLFIWIGAPGFIEQGNKLLYLPLIKLQVQ